jgi:hypothetical protein
MDVEKLIAELNAEIEVRKAAIACLEQLRGSSSAATNGSRRGRKSMDAQERLRQERGRGPGTALAPARQAGPAPAFARC